MKLIYQFHAGDFSTLEYPHSTMGMDRKVHDASPRRANCGSLISTVGSSRRNGRVSRREREGGRPMAARPFPRTHEENNARGVVGISAVNGEIVYGLSGSSTKKPLSSAMTGSPVSRKADLAFIIALPSRVSSVSGGDESAERPYTISPFTVMWIF